jgi:hypothetical protein
MDGEFKEGGSFTPRILRELKSDNSYSLFGWGQESDESTSRSVTVRGPQFCDENFPQIFCSSFETSNAFNCDAYLGSPLISVDEGLAGILINSERRCTTSGDRFVLNYISIGDFREWIDEVSAAKTNFKMSAAVMSVTLIIVFNYLM